MSTSTITAEGGTISLTTAPDGSISASSADFAVAVVQQVEGGGAGVTEYDTIAELVTASEGSLAPGYYEVLTVPATHPQSPRVLTYWDGAQFAPQISTGYESCPIDLDGKGWAWDALEANFRANVPIGIHTHMRNLAGSNEPIASYMISSSDYGTMNLSVQAQADYWRVIHTNTTSALSWGEVLTTSGAVGPPVVDGSHLLVFAGKLGASLSVNQSVPVWVGRYTSGSSRRGICIQSRGDSGSGVSDEWGFHLAMGSSAANTDYGYATGILPRAEGDVVILHYDKQELEARIWVNGVSSGVIAVTESIGFVANSLVGIGNAETTGKRGNYDYNYWACANVPTAEFTDTKADELTAWLQARYSIPPL